MHHSCHRNMQAFTDTIWGIIPAAGIGQRMQSAVPKQYLNINAKTVLQHSCERMLSVPQLQGLVVAIRDDDSHWQQVAAHLKSITDKPVITVTGGEERADSVLNAVTHLLNANEEQLDSLWVLVHDAVRPCVKLSDIKNLIEQAAAEKGGILAMPVRDTMKYSQDGRTITETVDRVNLWHALTPQFFHAETLLRALVSARAADMLVTDEASAMEMAGQRTLLVQGSEDNIKITRPADLQLAQLYLNEQNHD